MGVYDDRQSFHRLHATANPEKYDLAPIEYRHPNRALFKQNHENLNRKIQGVRLRAQKWNVGPERRKGLGTSRAYVWGNARHFCEAEPDYTGYEGERSGLNHWTDMPQGTRNESCGHIRKWTSVL